MAGPFIFIGTYTIQEGKLDDFKQHLPEFVATVEANEPRLIHFGAYFNDDGSDVSFVQVHPDPESMEFHMRAVGEHVEYAYKNFLAGTKSLQIFGAPNESTLTMARQLAGSGAPVHIKNEHKGFSRLPAGELA